MATLIAVERGREAANEDAFSDAPLMPACFPREELDVLLTEMVGGIGSMLHNGRFVGARGCLSGGEMLSIPGRGSSGRFADIAVIARCVVGAGACMIVYHAIDVEFFYIVLGVD